ncbi:Gnk2-homologous domain [Macleaya cordata]|uniref:Gnk2-homologous domain n=1 Tax=Macleaya cordata TaxID=56857 RepID=A0A200QG89_MACCD|nr:Gnk2-homologous domain [Macleaya cordata]
MTKRLCGNTIAGRIQLNGCYGLYEVAGFPQVSGVKMLYKSCGGSEAAGNGFDDRRNTAFGEVENGVGSGGGFYATSYQNMYVMGQCEGDLSSGDCVGCVKAAVQNAQVECGGSISGQIYLHKCYISYSYYPNGVPSKSSSSSSGSGHQNIGKTVAIVIGGTAAAGFVVSLLLFLKSLTKKRDDY